MFAASLRAGRMTATFGASSPKTARFGSRTCKARDWRTARRRRRNTTRRRVEEARSSTWQPFSRDGFEAYFRQLNPAATTLVPVLRRLPANYHRPRQKSWRRTVFELASGASPAGLAGLPDEARRDPRSATKERRLGYISPDCGRSTRREMAKAATPIARAEKTSNAAMTR